MRPVVRRALRVCLIATALFGSVDTRARPGGGSSFSRSSSSSSHSSSSGFRSSGSSYRSSSHGSSRSSSGSSGGSSYVPETSYRGASGKARALLWQPGGSSLYGASPERPESTRVTGSNETEVLVGVFGFLGLVGFFVVLMVVLAGWLLTRALRRPSGWSTHAVAAPPPPPARPVRRELEAIRGLDPDFSGVLFEDFLYALYTEAHVARGSGRLGNFAPYLRPEARAALERIGARPVGTVVVGAMRFVACSVDRSAGTSVSVEFEANYTESPPGAAAQSYYAAERWTLGRGAQARSRPPERARVFSCPSCGAPLDRIVGSACQYCGQVVDTGAFDWVVTHIEVQQREPRPPMLTGGGEEAGTQLPTVFDPGVTQALGELGARDPSFDRERLLARVGLVFQTLQGAWSSLQWEHARPFLSDNLWQAQSYWLSAYRQSGLRNVTERARITGLELVRAGSDRFYDAVTVRLYATGLDYTVRDADGAVVGGNRQTERPYSEYWTLIRALGCKGPARAEPVCPSCGAPLSITMAAACKHCGVKVNSGAFDWVLSRIEQDEAYAG